MYLFSMLETQQTYQLWMLDTVQMNMYQLSMLKTLKQCQLSMLETPQMYELSVLEKLQVNMYQLSILESMLETMQIRMYDL